MLTCVLNEPRPTPRALPSFGRKMPQRRVESTTAVTYALRRAHELAAQFSEFFHLDEVKVFRVHARHSKAVPELIKTIVFKKATP